MDETIELLKELLRLPAENLEVEFKNWLDLNDNEKKADIAKELIALANHGGGYLIFGFDESSEGFKPATKPEDTTLYNQDHINGIVERYAEPNFHCEVLQVSHSDSGEIHPIIVVPGGHTTPIHAKRDGPNGLHIRKLACYIRRPGGKSEVPRSSSEWQTLLQRCVRNNQEEFLDAIRGIVTGEVSTRGSATDEDRLREWINQSKETWEAKVHSYPTDSLSRYPFGAFSCAFFITDVSKETDLAELRELTRVSSPKVSGWSPFVTLRTPEDEPQRNDDALEAFVFTDTGPTAKPYLTVFWRTTTTGFGYSITGHLEDGWRSPQPGTVLDPRCQTRLVAEYLMFISNLASNLTEDETKILTWFEWTGLQGRQLQDILQVGAPIFNRVSGTDQVSTDSVFELNQLQNNLPEAVEKIMAKLFDHFSFFRAPQSFYQEQVNYLRRQSY